MRYLIALSAMFVVLFPAAPDAAPARKKLFACQASLVDPGFRLVDERMGAWRGRHIC